MKKIIIFALLSIFIFGCKSIDSNNWLIGKWKVDYQKTQQYPLGRQSLKATQEVVGENSIEWTKDKYICPDGGKDYNIIVLTPQTITFEYMIGNNKATETWFKDGEYIYFDNKFGHLVYMKREN